jgi:hypothetical protein
MTPENFVYWLQGMLEIGNVKKLNKEQVNIIKDHIKLVLTKVTPTYQAHPWTLSTTSINAPATLKMNESEIVSPSINYVIESTC